MTKQEGFVGQPIRSLQTMLRTISQVDSRIPSLIPDGIYSPQTQEAVKIFQSVNGLSPTGVVDQNTWERITDTYDDALLERNPPVPIPVTMGKQIRSGQQAPTVALAQDMLKTYDENLHCVRCPKASGKLDSDTEDALKDFQALCGLPCTGEIDRKTWKHLCLAYPLACNCKKGKTNPIQQ